MKRTVFLSLLALFLHAMPALAAESDADEASLETIEEEGSGKLFDAAVELRPSWTLGESKVHTENSLEGWWRPNANNELRYIQYWNTNMVNLKANASQGLGFELEPGWLVYKHKNIWSNSHARMQLDAEPTLILPTWETDRNAGKIGEARLFLKFSKELNDRFYFNVYEGPTIFAFSRPGSEVDEELVANPAFENRLYLVAGVNLSSKTTFEFPIWIIATRYRFYDEEAKYNNSWGAFVMIWPELDYAIDPHLTLGLSFYTDNFVAPDLSKLTVDNAFNKGAAQVVLRATL